VGGRTRWHVLSTDNFDQSDQAMVAVAGADDDFARWLIEQKLGAKQGDTLHYCLRACVGTGDIPAAAEVGPGRNCSKATNNTFANPHLLIS